MRYDILIISLFYQKMLIKSLNFWKNLINYILIKNNNNNNNSNNNNNNIHEYCNKNQQTILWNQLHQISINILKNIYTPCFYNLSLHLINKYFVQQFKSNTFPILICRDLEVRHNSMEESILYLSLIHI